MFVYITFIKIILVLISLFFIFSVYLRTRDNICRCYSYQFFAILFLLMIFLIEFFNENGLLNNISLEPLIVLFLVILAGSYMNLDSCIKKVQNDLMHKDQNKGLKFKVKKRK